MKQLASIVCGGMLMMFSWLSLNSQVRQSNDGMRLRADSLQEKVIVLHKEKQDYVRAIPLQISALELWRSLNDSVNIARALSILAHGFVAVGDTARGIRYAEESMLIFDRQADVRAYLSTLAWLAGLAMNSDSEQIASGLFARADAYIRERRIRDSSLIPSSLLVQRAFYALKNKDYSEALRYNALSERYYLARSANMNTKGRFQFACSQKVFIAEVYFAKGKFRESASVLASVRADSAQAGTLRQDLVLDWYRIAAKVYAAVGQYDSAYTFTQAAHALQDTLQQTSKAHILANAQFRFDTQRKDEIVSALEREQDLQNRTRTLLLIGIILLTLLFLVIAWAYHRKQRDESLLQERNAVLERLSNEKTEFLRVVAHDLKNPLLSVKMAAEQIHYSFGVAQNRAESIIHTSEAMLSAVKLLLRTQEESPEGYFWLNPPTTFDAVKRVRIILDDFAERAEAKGIEIDLQTSERIMMLTLDEDAFYRIVENLISNAVKFSPKQESITVQLDKMDNSCIFSVKNQGEGISAEEQKRLFQPYSHFAAQPTGGEHSSGLGLSIVKRYVDALGGTVCCESAVGKETTFIVNLPCVAFIP